MANPAIGQFLKFCVVGGVGFVVDGGLLYLLVHGGVSAYFARCISFPCAVLVTWWLNSAWTFQRPDGETARRGWQFWSYFGVQLAGALTNLVVYLLALPFTGTGEAQVLPAFALGSAAGLVVNYTGSRYLVFKGSGDKGSGDSGQKATPSG